MKEEIVDMLKLWGKMQLAFGGESIAHKVFSSFWWKQERQCLSCLLWRKMYYISKSNLHLPSCLWLALTPDVWQQSRRELEEVS